jgi:DNA-directed RNA polymerase specialized sigma24 family protein
MNSMQESSEGDLVQRMIANDSTGWEEFLRRYEARLRGYISHLVTGRNGYRWHRVEEIFQDLCVALVERDCARLRKFDPARGTLMAFLTVGIFRQVYSLFLRRERMRRAIKMTSPPDNFDIEDHHRFFEEVQWLVVDLVPTLSAEAREHFLAIWMGTPQDHSAVNRQREHRLRKRMEAFLTRDAELCAVG